jgi:hypothetical protein
MTERLRNRSRIGDVLGPTALAVDRSTLVLKEPSAMCAHGQPRSRSQTLATLFLSIPLAIVVSACSSAAGSSASPPSTDANATVLTTPERGAANAAPAGAPGAAAIGAIGGGAATTGTANIGSGTASNAAIAYPYPGYLGTSGVAADHTIVISGVGDAPLKADGSNRTTAQRTALVAALADAKAQADVVAQATGVTIHGVLSVSVASGQTYAYPLPAGVEGSAPGAASGGTTVPPSGPAVVQPAAPQLEVSVTVAYQIG